jgi:hypothetical protein
MKTGFLIGALLILINVPKTNSQITMPTKSEMKIRDLVILVKYAQGAVVFNSFFGYLKFMKAPERKVFISQVVELIGHFLKDDSAGDLAIRRSGLSDTCAACLILKEGVCEAQLQKIVELPESELESSFKLLLTLFSIGYQEGYQKYKNAPAKFWYWDYSNVENTYKFIEIDDSQYILLNEILKP